MYDVDEAVGKLKRGFGASMALRARSHGDRDTPAATAPLLDATTAGAAATAAADVPRYIYFLP